METSPPSPTRFLSNEVLLSGGLSQLVRLQLVIKLYSSVDIWIKPPRSRDALTGSPNYTSAARCRRGRLPRPHLQPRCPPSLPGVSGPLGGSGWGRGMSSSDVEPANQNGCWLAGVVPSRTLQPSEEPHSHDPTKVEPPPRNHPQVTSDPPPDCLVT